jgi:serine/threonine protein kinase
MIGKVGEGAYGVVWSALHLPTQRLYAIKVIQKNLVEKVRISFTYYNK